MTSVLGVTGNFTSRTGVVAPAEYWMARTRIEILGEVTWEMVVNLHGLTPTSFAVMPALEVPKP